MASSIIQSLDRGLKILSILAEARGPLSLNEITEHFTIDRSSVFRLIATLIQNGYVRQDEDNKKYTLGFKIMEIAGTYESQMQIDSIIRPVMHRICDYTGQNTHVGILDHNEVVFIAVEQPVGMITINIAVGTREPAAPTALGKALIAFMTPGRRDTFLSHITLEPFTDNSIRSMDAYLETIDTIRETRIAFDREEYKEGISCIAAPILNNRNEAFFSIGISGPSDMVMPHIDDYAAFIKKAALEASSQLGSTTRSK